MFLLEIFVTLSVRVLWYVVYAVGGAERLDNTTRVVHTIWSVVLQTVWFVVVQTVWPVVVQTVWSVVVQTVWYLAVQTVWSVNKQGRLFFSWSRPLCTH